MACNAPTVLPFPCPAIAVAAMAGRGPAAQLLVSIFAPEGWPSSVAPEYGRYQLWDTIQQALGPPNFSHFVPMKKAEITWDSW